jgi:hypothetical protein
MGTPNPFEGVTTREMDAAMRDVNNRFDAQGREIREVRRIAEGTDQKVDTVLQTLATNSGGVTAKKEARTGAKDLIFVALGFGSLVVAVIVAVIK